MSILDEPRWAFVALATAVVARPDGAQPDAALVPDVDRMAALAGDILAAGCNGIVPFGTTGEGPCFSVAQRIATVDGLIAAGIPADRIIVGIGATAMDDLVVLARHAAGLGCPVLSPPPFFLRAADGPGIVKAYGQLIAQVADPSLRLLLYNIPQVSGFAIPIDVMQALARAHPGIVVGVKDSAPDWVAVEPVVRQRGGLKVAVGVEPFISRAMALGGCGTICGLSNLAPRTAARAVAGDADANASLARLAGAFGDRAFLPTLKATLAGVRADDAWRHPMPPIDPYGADQVSDLVAMVRTMEARVWQAA